MRRNKVRLQRQRRVQELKAEEDAYTEEAKMAANKRKAVEKNMEMVGTAVATETTAPSLVITLL